MLDKIFWRFLKCFTVPFVYLLLALIVLRNVLLSPGLLGLFHDWGYFPYSNQYLQHFSSYPWDPTVNTGSGSTFSTVLPIGYLLGLAGFIGLDGEMITKVFSLILFTILGCSMYKSCRIMSIGRASALLAGLMFTLSPFVFDHYVSGHLPFLLSHSLCPLALALYSQCVSNQSLDYKRILPTILVFSLVGLDFVSWIVLPIALFTYSFVEILLAEKRFQTAVARVKVLILLLCASILLHAYWIAPTIFVFLKRGIYKIEPAYFPQILQIRIFSMPLLDSFRLMGFIGQYFKTSVLSSPSYVMWNLCSILLLIIVISALVTNPRSKIGLWAGCLALIAVFLGKGSQPPFGDFYLRLAGIFGEVVLSTPDRYLSLASVAYCLLLAFASETLGKASAGLFVRALTRGRFIVSGATYPRLRAAARLVLLVSLVTLIGLSSWPFFTGDFDGKVQAYSFGSEYQRLNEFLINEPEDVRVLWWPPNGAIQYKGSKFYGPDLMAMSSHKPSVWWAAAGAGSGFMVQYLSFLVKDGITNNFGKILSILGVKYVIFHGASSYLEKAFPDLNRNALAYFERQRDLKLVWSDGDIRVFKNLDNLPHIRATFSSSIVTGDLSALVSLSQLNRTFENSVLYFAAQAKPGEFRNDEFFDTIYVVGNSYLDYVMSFVPNEFMLSPGAIVVHSQESPDPKVAWLNLRNRVMDPLIVSSDYVTSLYNAAYSESSEPLNLPFHWKETGEAEILVNAFVGPSASDMTVFLDGQRISSLKARSKSPSGYMWQSVLSGIKIDQGYHTISLKAESIGKNAVARVAIVPSGTLANARASARESLETKQVVALFEFDKLDQDTGLVVEDMDANNGRALEIRGQEKFRSQLYIPRAGNYDVLVRVSAAAGTSLVGMIGETTLKAQIRDLGYAWHVVSKTKLEAGNVPIDFQADSPCRLDQLLVIPSEPKAFRTEPPTPEYHKLNPSEYEVSMNLSCPMFIMFGESFDPNWKATCDGQEILPMIGYSFGNYYWINKTGYVKILLKYKPVDCFRLGSLISASSVLIVAAILFNMRGHRRPRLLVHEPDG